jgi:hypothetical protein
VAKRYVRGDRAFVRLLKKLPDSAQQEIRGQLVKTGQTVVALQRRLAPIYGGNRKGVVPGALQAGLSFSVPPIRLSLKVGLVGKAINRKLFYGWIVEWGRKASVVTVTRAGSFARAKGAGLRVRPNNHKAAALAAGISGTYQLHVRAMAPRHFVYVAGLRQQIYPAFRNIWDKALARAAAGASDD